MQLCNYLGKSHNERQTHLVRASSVSPSTASCRFSPMACKQGQRTTAQRSAAGLAKSKCTTCSSAPKELQLQHPTPSMRSMGCVTRCFLHCCALHPLTHFAHSFNGTPRHILCSWEFVPTWQHGAAQKLASLGNAPPTLYSFNSSPRTAQRGAAQHALHALDTKTPPSTHLAQFQLLLLVQRTLGRREHLGVEARTLPLIRICAVACRDNNTGKGSISMTTHLVHHMCDSS